MVYVLTFISGQPEKSSSVNIHITVLDVNDNSPQFTAATYYAEVSPAHRVGDAVVKVEATDADDGLNAEVRYLLLEQTEIVTINAESGNVTLMQDPNTLKTMNVSLTVMATDGGTPPLSNNAVIVLVIHGSDLTSEDPPITTTPAEKTTKDTDPSSGSIVRARFIFLLLLMWSTIFISDQLL